MGKAGRELTVQFLYRILEIVKEYGIEDFTLGLFSKNSFFTGESFAKFRELWNKHSKFIEGFEFPCEEFEGTQPGWAVHFSVWKVFA